MFSYLKKPDIPEKMTELAESARYDVCLATCSTGAGGRSGRSRSPENPLTDWIYPASVPGRGKVHILKILQSNSCRNNCGYCHFAAGNSGVKRVSMSPDELASAFMRLVRARLVEGIFISSGVCGTASDTMEKMIKSAEILRTRYRFGGYIHLKIIPGCDEHLIDAAARYANRLSINLEAPTEDMLNRIAPDKNLARDILPAAARAAGLLEKKAAGSSSGIRAVSQTTQFVVGAAGESDLDILNTVDCLYREYFFFRAYFSAWQKRGQEDFIKATPTDDADGFSGSPLLREHRLYQCDFLMRAYGFRFPDIVFDKSGNIPLETDPKTAWAVMHPEYFPVEINTASEDQLLRVPGIGPVSAGRIIELREKQRFSRLESLRAVGAWTERAAGWIEISGRKAESTAVSGARAAAGRSFNPSQKWLFEELAPAGWKPAGRHESAILPRSSISAGSSPAAADESEDEYPYPAQKGRWVNYLMKKSEPKIMCR